MTTLRISRIGGPITVLGPGRRLAVWVQGCTIGCVGCASTDTWSVDAGTVREVDSVAEELLGMASKLEATGLTISGGEPFQQPEAVAELIRATRERWPVGEPDVLVFTGYAAGAARRRSPELWSAADVIVAGPYRADRASAHPLLGSSNQTIEVLTALGESRMRELRTIRRPLQVGMQEGNLTLVGMPDPGDLDRIRDALRARGVRMTDVSWAGGNR